MYQPNFSFTIKMVNEISQIERLYGQLQTEKLIPSLALKLAQENQILATHYSRSIEGNPLSPRDVTNIILDDKIPTTKSETEVVNYFKVLNQVFSFARDKKEITPQAVLDLHHMLMRGIEKKDLGKFRDSGVFIGHREKTGEYVVKHNPPYHTEKDISDAIVELFTWAEEDKNLHPLIRAGIIHHEFAYIHPFFDGNGRMARIITAYFLLLHKYEVVKYFILDDYYDIDRTEYSDMLHSADKPGKGESRADKTSWLEYFLEGIVNSLTAAFGKIEELKRGNLDDLEGEKRVLVSKREEDVLQIVVDRKAIKSSDIVDRLSVSRQQAHQLISSLVRKKLLTKYGKTKQSYYKLTDAKK